MFEAGILQDPYPLRGLDKDGKLAASHSLSTGERPPAKLRRAYKAYLEVFRANPEQLNQVSALRQMKHHQRFSVDLIAREFARFALSCQQSGLSMPGPRHLASAYALVHRRLECVPAREDRVLIAGLAAAVLAASGMQVHLIVENDLAVDYVAGVLTTVLERLSHTVMCVRAGMDEMLRMHAYQQAVTIVSARECAMDFLRDAVKWPGRGNVARRRLEGMMGEKSQLRGNILRGLPCAILIDADSTLIDNARTPIALTRDAHPMHEADALKQALEMAQTLQRGMHYELIGEGAEIAITDQGQQQLDAWGAELGGPWQVNNAARLMLAAALVVTQLLESGEHYKIDREQVVWLLDERLIPGLMFYSEDFLRRLVALHEECEQKQQREVAARASYQQIFNRYVHLCGLLHSADPSEAEYRKIYGLKCGHRWPPVAIKRFDRVLLVKDSTHRQAHLKAWLHENEGGASLILANDEEALLSLQQALQEDFPRLQRLPGGGEAELHNFLVPGAQLLAFSQDIEYLMLLQPDAISAPLTIIMTQRSDRCAEDLRSRYWMQRPELRSAQRMQLLVADEELFAESSQLRMRIMVRFSGGRVAAYWLERQIRRIQLDQAKSLYNMRQQLMEHDQTMQGLLSFSGRGLYE